MGHGQVSIFESVLTSSYILIRDWRDQSSTTLYEAQKGLGTRDRLQRQILFGPNLVDIKGKSVFSLLVEEVRKRPECSSK
jgi:cation-transporting P-type ATPase 13A2